MTVGKKRWQVSVTVREIGRPSSEMVDADQVLINSAGTLMFQATVLGEWLTVRAYAVGEWRTLRLVDPVNG